MSLGQAGAGAVATQNVTDPSIGNEMLDLMAQGLDAPSALASVMDDRPFAQYRQVTADLKGNIAERTGSEIFWHPRGVSWPSTCRRRQSSFVHRRAGGNDRGVRPACRVASGRASFMCPGSWRSSRWRGRPHPFGGIAGGRGECLASCGFAGSIVR